MQSNIAFRRLLCSQKQEEKLSLPELLSFPLSPVRFSLGTPDGYLLKTDTSKNFHYLYTKEVESEGFPPSAETLAIEDGNALLYYIKDIPKPFNTYVPRYLTCYLLVQT